MSHSFSAVVLAAGYGTRLDRDVRDDASGAHSSLIGLSKALVPVGGTTVLGHWLRQLAECGVDQVAIVTNHAHVNQFTKEVVPLNVRVVDDLSSSNADRLGAVADLQLALDSFRSDSNSILSFNSDFVVIAGDTLFHRGAASRFSHFVFSSMSMAFIQIFICVTFWQSSRDCALTSTRRLQRLAWWCTMCFRITMKLQSEVLLRSTMIPVSVGLDVWSRNDSLTSGFSQVALQSFWKSRIRLRHNRTMQCLRSMSTRMNAKHC